MYDVNEAGGGGGIENYIKNGVENERGRIVESERGRGRLQKMRQGRRN